MIGMETLVVVAHTAMGYVAGLVLPRLLAMPVALLVSGLWMAFPGTLDTFWVRQLNGRNLIQCCSLDQSVDPRAIAAPALVALGLIAAALILVRMRPLVGRTLAAVVIAAAITAGAFLAMPLGYHAASARDASALSCDAGTPVVCLWPEQREDTKYIREWTSEAAQRLAAAGVEVAPRITLLSAHPEREETLAVVAMSAIPQQPPACATAGEWPGHTAQGPLMAWLILSAGADQRFVQGSHTVEDMRTVREVRKLPQPDQLRWFERNAATLRNCVEQPQLQPGGFGNASQGEQ
ncbi:hypothetical protein [Streptomyces fradiae]|uniref:DUF7224 domain-containing protein n=1 Tax=Streptomyces fradiae TaxID=1906 RepID=UPI0033F93399